MQVLRMPGALPVARHAIAGSVQDALRPQPVRGLPVGNAAHRHHGQQHAAAALLWAGRDTAGLAGVLLKDEEARVS